MSKRPTITDVAEHAGVSPATVSAAVNGKPGVSDGTRRRVLDAVSALNYRPQASARRRGAAVSGGVIALVAEDEANPHYAEIARGARDAASPAGFTVVTASSGGSPAEERRIVDTLVGKDVDGLLLMPALGPDTDLSHLFELKQRNVPFVLLEAVVGVQAPSVDVDNEAAATTAVAHLLGLGHRRVAHFAGPPSSFSAQARLRGVRRAFSGSPFELTDDAVVPAGSDVDAGHQAGLAFFGDRPAADRPTAATCFNDLVALGLIRALTELGLGVPGDVSVVGFDDLALLQHTPYALTTVAMPKQTKGWAAVELLLPHIQSHEPREVETVQLQHRLVVRDTTAPPRP